MDYILLLVTYISGNTHYEKCHTFIEALEATRAYKASEFFLSIEAIRVAPNARVELD